MKADRLNLFDVPFPADDIEWRIQQSAKSGDRIWARVLPYVTNRAIMDRLDDVAGRADWQNEYAPGPDGGVKCRLSIRIDGEWITKEDGAENTDIEAVKGGMSNSMKRAAVQWGIGRYLYGLEEGYAETSTEKKPGWHFAKLKDGGTFYWQPPRLPAWALPEKLAGRDKQEFPHPHKVRTKEYLAMVAKPLADVLDHPDFVAAWPGGVEELKTFAMAQKFGGFSAWSQAEQCTELAPLASLKSCMDLESAKRAVAAMDRKREMQNA